MVSSLAIEQDAERIVAEARQRLFPTDLGWLAGIFDGEGSVYIRRVKRAGGGHYYTLAAFVVNCDPRVTEKCRELSIQILGNSKGISCYKRKTREGCAPIFRWESRGDAAAAVLRVLRPFLISKRDQTDVGLRLQALVSAHKTLIGAGVVRTARVFSPEQIQERENLYQNMRWLNSTGLLRGWRMQWLTQEKEL